MKLKYVLLVILFAAAFLRLYQLSSIPGSLNQDEAAIGYNAYSILKTGADEHGKFLPLSLQSFGDWKLPVYEYIDIPFIAFLGLNEISVRLPSAIAGILSVFLIYKITSLFFKEKSIPLFASFFMAVSPWSIYFSRAAYEVNLATTLFLGGAFFLFAYLLGKKNFSDPIYASLLFGLTLFTYHSYILFIPLFLSGMAIIFYKKFKWNRSIIIGLSLIIFFMGISLFTLSSTGSNKISTLSIVNNKDVIYNRADKIRGDTAGDNSFLSKIVYNKYVAVVYQFTENYIGVFSPDFLFDKGGEKLQHNLGYFGNFYLFDFLLLSAGLLAVFWNHEKIFIYLVPWFLAGPIPSALTTDTPNSTRLFILMPLGIIIMSYCAGKIINKLQTKKYFYVGALLTFLFLANMLLFLDGYFLHFNAQRISFWRYGNKQIVELAKNYPHYKIVVRGPEDFHYIYFLFYEKYDPQKFIKEVKYYPLTSEGFLYVKSFDRYEFVKSIDYGKLKSKTIYISDHVPKDQLRKNLLPTINLPSGETVFVYTISEYDKK